MRIAQQEAFIEVMSIRRTEGRRFHFVELGRRQVDVAFEEWPIARGGFAHLLDDARLGKVAGEQFEAAADTEPILAGTGTFREADSVDESLEWIDQGWWGITSAHLNDNRRGRPAAARGPDGEADQEKRA